jgi:hypothetical protein
MEHLSSLIFKAMLASVPGGVDGGLLDGLRGSCDALAMFFHFRKGFRRRREPDGGGAGKKR